MYKITSPYGIRTRPNTNKKEFTSGIDLVSKDNSVRPLQNGTIINIGVQGDGRPGFKDPAKYKELGFYIDMRGDDGLFYRFGHVDPIKNKEEFIGRKVQAGEPLWSYAKGSGSGTGPHMKMYVSEDPSFRKKIDPTPIVNDFVKNPTKPSAETPTTTIAESKPAEINHFDEINSQLAQLGQDNQYKLPELQSSEDILAAYNEMVGGKDQSSIADNREAFQLAQQQERAAIEAQQRQIALSQRQHDENKAREKQALEKDINDRMFANFSSGMNNMWAPQSSGNQDEQITLPSQKIQQELPEELKPDYRLSETPRFSDGQSYLG